MTGRWLTLGMFVFWLSMMLGVSHDDAALLGSSAYCGGFIGSWITTQLLKLS